MRFVSQPMTAWSERGALLQQARDGRAVDQRGKASGGDDATELSSLPLKPGTAGIELVGLQLGQFVAAAGVAQWNRELVATSLQQRLVKTGARLVKHARYYWLLLAESHLTKRLFGVCSGGSPGCRFQRDSPGCGTQEIDPESRVRGRRGEVSDKTGWEDRGQQLGTLIGAVWTLCPNPWARP